MSEDHPGPSPIERVADVFVFAPIGLVLEARELWPELVRSGRRFLGARLEGVQDQADAAFRGLGLVSGSNGADDDRPAAVVRRVPSVPRPAVVRSEPPVDVDLLAIPDYDALSASQVVPRLEGLARDELELVRQYESGTRGRKTILNRIAQLQAG